MASRTPRWPSIGLISARRSSRKRKARTARPSEAAVSSMSSSERGRNSCSGGSNRRTVTGRPAMVVNNAEKSSVIVDEAVQSGTAVGLVLGEDHAAERHHALGRKEHVFRAGEADAFRPETEGRLRRLDGFGVGAHADLARCVRPAEELAHGAANVGLGELQVAGTKNAVADAAAHLGGIHSERANGRDAGLAGNARDNRGVTGHAAAGGED